MISLTNYDFQWARSELVIIYPDHMGFLASFWWVDGDGCRLSEQSSRKPKALCQAKPLPQLLITSGRNDSEGFFFFWMATLW